MKTKIAISEAFFSIADKHLLHQCSAEINTGNVRQLSRSTVFADNGMYSFRGRCLHIRGIATPSVGHIIDILAEHTAASCMNSRLPIVLQRFAAENAPCDDRRIAV